MYSRLLQNHVLANISFILVLVVGGLSYSLLPRQQDPTINFNWIQISTFLPGASAEDVEKRLTDPLEDAIRNLQDVRFVSSISRESFSSILVRFNDIDERLFDKRVNDLRREVQNKESELPDEATSPSVLEITTANGFPSAQVVVSGPANDENLRIQARNVEKDLERIRGIDRVDAFGLRDPELQVRLIPERLQALGVDPTFVADTITANFRDVAAGNVQVGQQSWLVRLIGTSSDPSQLADLPVLTSEGEVSLGSIADIQRGREKAERLVSYDSRPAVYMSIFKAPEANTLDLVDDIRAYIASRERFRDETGVSVILVDDQTEVTRNALRVMQTNALLGLFLVMVVTCLFLGFRIAFFTSIAIPFVLCGIFWSLYAIGQTLNVIVLLGIVISLGMLVDDAVVVVESIYYRLQRGAQALDAALDALREVVAPVTTSVLTTIAAFLPLMLLPGILGKFMFVVPFVVTLALVISLVEAYWMLPAHIIASNVSFAKPSKTQRWRVRALHLIRLRYTRLLIKAMRYPLPIIGTAFGLLLLSILAMATGVLKFDFFASDPLRLFYINVQMPAGTPLEKTLDKVVEIEYVAKAHITEPELRSMVSYSGLSFTETEVVFSDNFGQIVVSLQPLDNGIREVGEIIEGMRDAILAVPGTDNVSFQRLSGGPPTTLPITIKVRGDDFYSIRRAAADLQQVMSEVPGVKDIKIDDSPGQKELLLTLNQSAIRAVGLDPRKVMRIVRLYIDGEIVAAMQDQGEELEVRVQSKPQVLQAIDDVLRQPVALPNGGSVPLGQLVDAVRGVGIERIRHYNFRRSIEVSADIEKDVTDTVSANQAIIAAWDSQMASRHPNIDLDTSGVLDDIFDSLGAMGQLFLLGLLLIYLILGTQFRSYFQPLLILSTVPLAFIGVVLGLIINRNAMSLYTLYGVVALAGIAVNSAIVLISTANARLKSGMGVLHATLYAARRRVVPILITSLTTIAGLSSLALGLGGYSLLWGPMASSIVWGLSFSTILTLFVIPLLYEFFMRLATKSRG